MLIVQNDDSAVRLEDLSRANFRFLLWNPRESRNGHFIVSSLLIGILHALLGYRTKQQSSVGCGWIIGSFQQCRKLHILAGVDRVLLHVDIFEFRAEDALDKKSLRAVHGYWRS